MVAMKSTVPPDTSHTVLEDELHGTGIGYAANPELLRAGQALADWDRPDRIVIGTEPVDTHSLHAVRRLYGNIGAPVPATDVTTAEMVKYASDAFRPTRISFMNEIAAICQGVGRPSAMRVRVWLWAPGPGPEYSPELVTVAPTCPRTWATLSV